MYRYFLRHSIYTSSTSKKERMLLVNNNVEVYFPLSIVECKGEFYWTSISILPTFTVNKASNIYQILYHFCVLKFFKVHLMRNVKLRLTISIIVKNNKCKSRAKWFPRLWLFCFGPVRELISLPFFASARHRLKKQHN